MSEVCELEISMWWYGTLLLCVVCGLFGAWLMERNMRKEAAKHNAAEYDQQTGAWRWKVLPP